MGKKSCIFLCRCKAGVVSAETIDAISASLKKLDADVVELQDLCAMSLVVQNELNAVGNEYDQKIIIACYPRAVKNMLSQNNIDFGDFQVLNFKNTDTGTILTKLKSNFGIKEGKVRYREMAAELEVPAWFPVIDKSLCTFCGKCARFCLFGVYSYSKNSLKVVDPLACKNNCPACGRTCPTSAIMFPRLSENTILAGEEPHGQKVSIDKGSLLSALHDRNLGRRNIFRRGVMEQAEEERRKALLELKLKQDNTRNNDKANPQKK